MKTGHHAEADGALARPARREFVAASLAAGLAAATGAVHAQGHVVESDVAIKTGDGTCDAAFVRPADGVHPGVIVWPDAAGLRPAMRDIAKRLAAEGYAVLVPNPFYRVSPAPQFETASTLDFSDAATRAKLQPLMASIQATGAAERDAAAFVEFLDAQAAVDKTRKLGTQGYCMGGALVLRTAAALPSRVGAGASFHGGGLVTDRPDSPHRLAPKIKARLYIAIASNDDRRQPGAKDALRDAFASAGVPAEIEVYPARHGWCVPDMPVEGGAPIYDRTQAERAWTALERLYKKALA